MCICTAYCCFTIKATPVMEKGENSLAAGAIPMLVFTAL